MQELRMTCPSTQIHFPWTVDQWLVMRTSFLKSNKALHVLSWGEGHTFHSVFPDCNGVSSTCQGSMP